MKKFLYILLCLLVSCTADRETDIMLDRIENLINDQPKQAYELLRCIDGTKISSESVKARYALLYTKAQYKNYIDTPNDSLISIAVEYYENHDTKKELMESLLQLGIKKKLQGHYSEAMLCMKRAADIGEDICDCYYLGQIYTNLFQLCTVVYDADELKYAEKAYANYKKHGDDNYTIDAMNNIGISYYRAKEWDKSEAILDSVYIQAKQVNDVFTIKKSAQVIAMIKVFKSEYDEAESIFKMLHNDYGYKYRPQDLLALAETHLARNEKQQALQLIDEASAMVHDDRTRIVYESMASNVLSKAGDYQGAWSHLMEYRELRDSVINSHLQESIMAVQRDYVEQKLEIEQVKSNRNNILWMCFASGLLAFLAFTFYYFNRQKVTRSLEMEKLLLQMAEIRDVVANREATIEGLNRQIQTTQEASDKLQLHVSDLINQKYQQLDDLCVSYFNGQSSMFTKNAIYRKVQNIVENFGSDNEAFADLETMVNTAQQNVLDLLKSELPNLKEKDYQFFCYVFAGFSSRSISLLMNENIDTVYQHRSRWKKRLEALDIPHKDLFLQHFK